MEKPPMAQLTPEQHTAVESWAAAGATLNDIQRRLKEDFAVTMTYLDARLLMMELDVKIKDKPKPLPAPEPVAILPPAAATAPQGHQEEPTFTPGNAHGAAANNVKITLDAEIAPGTMVSGKVTFSDGKTAAWYIDQGGRLGLKGNEPGYQPPAPDVPIFQQELDRVLMEAGY
jgi:molybdopterin converting factor small subunit